MVELNYIDAIKQRVAAAEDGTLFIGSDFGDIASDDAVRKTLSRLVGAGELERPLRGIFRKPGFNAFLSEPTVAGPDEIAHAIARKFGWSIAPAGDTALNMLGMDTQVPTVFHYVSDGPYRAYEYGPFVLDFAHTANKEISSLTEASSTVVQALKARGKDNVSNADLRRIAERLDERQLKNLLDETKTTTVWIRETVKRIPSKKEIAHA